ncbi:hypothetical protein NUU61_007553 [Penicillium alfredii]|uniref:Major facilitator superfamily (MFS) profile domain-containing protein n=1 Tax=Penicillium alfredii TaxID=1506179 RepID=A0A9W9EQZ4_9EURO|nr:uncharacterized protein NUU61_007553 [Penicillium alfredii]KAJ5086246.1 hypothetical protein NUU61_007553 [Penicillium alfredii]
MSNRDVLAEKSVGEQIVDAPASETDQGIVKDWDGEEAAVRRKIDCILLPILALAFFSLQMDRGNISAVLTSTITKDLHITTNQINIGTQLLSAGIVLSEIPSNIILLGFCEGGFIPGALYYLSTWYKKDETSVRTSLSFYGQMFASATSSLISAGLLKLAGTSGLEGWRWIFLVEGLITLFIGTVFTLLVPPEAGDGRALIGMGRWSYFTERESRIIRARVILDDPTKSQGHIQISWSNIREPSNSRALYTPSMIKSLGFSAVHANALTSVPVYCSIVWLTILSFAADYTGHRGPFVLLAITWNVITYACLRASPYAASKWHRYGVTAVANVSYCSMHILNVGWLSIYCRTPQERSVAMALAVMAANRAGISGSQIFRTSDAPKYLHGLTAVSALAGASWVLALGLFLQYYISPRKSETLGKDTNRVDE